MNYLQWNNAIGNWFFNQEKAEEEVYLFISRYDIIKIGKEIGLAGSDEEIFLDYIDAIKKGIPGRPFNGNILEQALYAFQKWQNNPIKIDGVPIEYPLYIGYLALFVLPLTERNQPNLRVDAYYPRIKTFLEKNSLPPMPTQNEHYNWNALWDDLFLWSFEKKNTELGYFEVHPFQNERWIYVGKPLSQSIFPIHALRQLPQLFELSGFTPEEEISNNEFRKLLLSNGNYLGLSTRVLRAISDTSNELGNSIINIVRKNYQGWRGNTDKYEPDTESIKKGKTVAQLRLCIEGDKARGYKTYYRLYTKLDFPEDLAFVHNDREYKCQQFSKGWSRPLFLPFVEGIEIQDSLNKWKAKFPEKDVRLLIEGKNFHLSGWVEVPHMVSSKMILLAKKERSKSIEEWGECFSEGDFKELSAVGIPGNYTLFEVSNPPISHPDIPALQFSSDKRLVLTGGLKVGVRTWLNSLLPDVELEGGRGNEVVYMTYDDSEERIQLERKNTAHPVWKLPPHININKGFHIKVEGDSIKGEQLKNYVIDSSEKVGQLNEESLPARDKLGQVMDQEKNSSYVKGCKLYTTEERNLQLRQTPYIWNFKPQTTHCNCKAQLSQDLPIYNDLLVTFLTIKGKTTAKDYFEAFESIYQRIFGPKEIESHSIDLSRLKRWSINYLDYMGILDYEYSTKKIVVNPPQLLLLPTRCGRKVLLVGGRTPELIQKIKTETDKEGLQLNLEAQDTSLSSFVLPPTVTITGFDEYGGNNVERTLGRIAEACSISFDPGKLPQFRLAEFSGSMDEYICQLQPDERFDDSGWPARVFDADQLRFIPIPSELIDKSCALVEYRLTEYSFIHRFWKNGVPHNVNKNWGRYMILNHHGKEVIFNDRKKNIIAIPATLPLPRLISEAMTLFSGKAPKRKLLEIEGYKTWFNVFENIPPVFGYNYFMKVGQKQKEITISI